MGVDVFIGFGFEDRSQFVLHLQASARDGLDAVALNGDVAERSPQHIQLHTQRLVGVAETVDAVESAANAQSGSERLQNKPAVFILETRKKLPGAIPQFCQLPGHEWRRRARFVQCVVRVAMSSSIL
jgi:hypothetical protein